MCLIEKKIAINIHVGARECCVACMMRVPGHKR